MRLLLTLGFCLLALVVRAADTPDNKAMQGVWLPVQAELGGKPVPEAILKSIVLKIDKNDWLVTVAGEPDLGTLTLAENDQPKGMSITGVKGPNAGKIFPAIYEIKDDTFRICYDLSGVKRPTEFKTTDGTKLFLVTYQRKKT